MNFAAEYRMEPEDKTQCAGLSPLTENNSPAIEYLVAIRKNRHLVRVFLPREKNITFGRSSRCSITLPDPRFSRKAGEIVLGPVPILRRYNNGEENSENIPIQPGKPYRIRPYTLTLMESGDVIFNRNKQKDGNKTGMLRSIIFILVALGAGSILFLHQSVTGNAAVPGQGSASSPIITEQNRDEITVKPEITVSKVTPVNSKPTPRKKESVAPKVLIPVTRLRTEKKIKEITMSGKELDKAIGAAASLIGQGNLKMAGRTLSPLLPHVSIDQRASIIAALDPPIQTLFRKAYMLKPYEPEKSKKILLSIVESGMKILPSYGKARKMLEEGSTN